MSISSLIGDNTLWIGILLIGGFVCYKFILEPIMNEGKLIEPSDEDVKTFGEKMEENLNVVVDF